MSKKELFTSFIFVILLVVLSSTNNTKDKEIQVESDGTKELANKVKPEIDSSKYEYSLGYLLRRVLRELYQLDTEKSDFKLLAMKVYDKYRSEIDMQNWSDSFLSTLLDEVVIAKKRAKVHNKTLDKILIELYALDPNSFHYNDMAYEIFDKYRDKIEEYGWPDWYLEKLRAIPRGPSEAA